MVRTAASHRNETATSDRFTVTSQNYPFVSGEGPDERGDRRPDSQPGQGQSCPACGTAVAADARSCPECGAEVSEPGDRDDDSQETDTGDRRGGDDKDEDPAAGDRREPSPESGEPDTDDGPDSGATGEGEADPEGAPERPASTAEEPTGGADEATGQSLSPEPVGERRQKSRVAAAVLAVFLGGLGAHRFYLGSTTTGVLYLCFVWTLIPVVLGVLEGIRFLLWSDEEFLAKYGD